jgi:hypothetical protein
MERREFPGEENTDRKMIKKLLLFAACCLLFAARPLRAADTFAAANYDLATRQISADIGDLGAALAGNFTPSGQLIRDFVPIEAQVGRFLLSALSQTSRAVYDALIPFMNIFVAVLFAFWVFMESWQMMNGDLDYWGLGKRIADKVVLIAIWMWALNNDPASLFMWLMSPVITLGSVASDLILNGTANIIGTNLPDSCAAIHSWIGSGGGLLIDGQYAADLLCMPTRVMGFFYTCVAAGLGWMRQGLGTSGLTFLLGLIFVILFIYNIWKFALAALNVIVDLFFVLLFLPFTAVSECFKGGTTYKGMFAPLWTQMKDFVSGESISIAGQFRKFINAIIYFVVLSIVCAICVILVAGVNPMAPGAAAFGSDAITILIIGCLAAYLMGQADTLANSLGGKIEGDVGKQIGDTAIAAVKGIGEWGKNAIKILTKKP